MVATFINSELVGIDQVVEKILYLRRRVSRHRSVLIAVSGIDGSGKGYLTRELEARLAQYSYTTANINIDGWLNLPEERFSASKKGEHFYRNAIRFDEMFSRLVLPLRDNRSVEVVADFAEETASDYRRHRYKFKNVDVILLEGIFLFKREYRDYFDLRVWVECSFQTALARALKRKQEGLSNEDTVRAYENIYFPAQRVHMELDQPVESADLIVNNETQVSCRSKDFGS